MHRPDDLGPALREVRIADGITQSARGALASVGRQQPRHQSCSGTKTVQTCPGAKGMAVAVGVV